VTSENYAYVDIYIGVFKSDIAEFVRELTKLSNKLDDWINHSETVYNECVAEEGKRES
jgi:hypothetical protein